MKAVLWNARRELASFFLGALGIGTWVAFLVAQGATFSATVFALADPAQPAAYGTVLRGHFGGTFLYWALLFFVASILAMRQFAEDKHRGTWDLVRSAPVTDTQLVVGKWLGSYAAFLVLWLPTLAYPLVLELLAPAGMSVDVRAVASAYAGVAVTGAGVLALVTWLGTLVPHPGAAATLAFTGLLVWFLAGLVPELLAGGQDHVGLQASPFDLRHHMDDFARGIVDARHVVLHAALTVACLSLAVVTVAWPRTGTHGRRRHVAGAAVVVSLAALAVVVASRHPLRVDVTRAGVHRLDASTRKILDAVDGPVHVLVVAGDAPEFVPVWDEVRTLLVQMQARTDALHVTTLDPAKVPERAEILAQRLALGRDELTGGGAVVFESGGRTRAVTLLDMADFGRDVLGGGALTAFRAEALFVRAIGDVTRPVRPRVCVSEHHGELGLEPLRSGLDASLPTKLLEEDGYEVKPLTSTEALPGCSALLVLGPTRAFSAREERAVRDWLSAGGRLLVAAGAVPTADLAGFEKLGLELPLIDMGLLVAPAIVVDPAARTGLPHTWATLEGYSDHPIASPLGGRRITVWTLPRLVRTGLDDEATTSPLVYSSDSGWAEADWQTLLENGQAERDADDASGPAVVAAASQKGSARAVLLGSARSFTTALVSEHPANGLLLRSAVAWLTGQTDSAALASKTPEQFRLVVTPPQAGWIAIVCALGIPLLTGGALALVVWARRRA